MKSIKEIQEKHPERYERGQNYKAQREELGFSRASLAEVLEVKETTIANLENGQGAYDDLRKRLDVFFAPLPKKGGEFKALREEKELTQKALSEELGIKPNRLSKFENEKGEDTELRDMLLTHFGLVRPEPPKTKKGTAKAGTKKAKAKKESTQKSSWYRTANNSSEAAERLAAAKEKQQEEAKTIAKAKLRVDLEKAGVYDLLADKILNRNDLLEVLK